MMIVSLLLALSAQAEMRLHCEKPQTCLAVTGILSAPKGFRCPKLLSNSVMSTSVLLQQKAKNEYELECAYQCGGGEEIHCSLQMDYPNY